MSLPDPFGWLSDAARNRALMALAALTVVQMIALDAVGRPLIDAVAPYGIVSFEFAGDLDAARAMLASWGESGRLYAALVLGLDYLFLVSYASAIALGCLVVARGLARRGARAAAAGVPLAWALLAAALLDAVENYALIQLLLGSDDGFWARLAYGCALPKFAFVVAGLAYLLAGAGWIAWRRGRRRSAQLGA
ncbi:MAG: hypothetical protein JSU66_09895 [Deltaproteobacteria bacterium]|nr:MAG: hypothetical protein JSU66_09895 [Deltaproteobacteria bacterium]